MVVRLLSLPLSCKNALMCGPRGTLATNSATAAEFFQHSLCMVHSLQSVPTIDRMMSLINLSVVVRLPLFYSVLTRRALSLLETRAHDVHLRRSFRRVPLLHPFGVDYRKCNNVGETLAFNNMRSKVPHGSCAEDSRRSG